VEETPEEILARLQRYIDSVRTRGPESAAIDQVRPADTAILTAAAPGGAHSLGTVGRTIAGQVLCVAACAVTILLWINVAHGVTYVLVLCAAALCAVGLTRHVPFSAWVLLGLVLGLVLGRFS
jgi:hypothetical protein